MAVVAVNKVKTVKSDNELFEEAESSMVAARIISDELCGVKNPYSKVEKL